jgi:Rieske Fe-S protein
MSTSNKNELSRRDFIKASVAAIGSFIGAVIAIPSIVFLLSPSLKAEEASDSIDLGPLENYPVGIPTRFDFTRTEVNGWERTSVNYGLFVVRKSENEVRVFSDICTHLGCRVSWHPDVQHYISPCHDGHFDIRGKNISGPPPRPLDEFITTVENGNLSVTLPPFRRTA